MKRSRALSSQPPPPPPPPPYSDIPIEFLLSMGSSEITLNGVKITTHVLDSAAAVDKHIAELQCYLEYNAKIVGLDIKNKVRYEDRNYYYNPDTIVLCVFCRCLIIQLASIGSRNSTTLNKLTPQSLDDFFNDPKICFVGVTTLPDLYQVKFSVRGDVGVKVGDLAARVLRRPELTEFSLPDIAKEVGVSYQGGGATADVVVASEMVFSDKEIKDVLTDAYAYYLIGYNLLTSL